MRFQFCRMGEDASRNDRRGCSHSAAIDAEPFTLGGSDYVVEDGDIEMYKATG